MPGIPTVPGTESVQTRTPEVKLDFNALNAPNRANMDLAGAVGDVGGALGHVAKQMQEVKNYGILADADRKMRQTTADFQAGLVGRTDESDWEQDWKDRAQGVQQSLYDDHNVGPAVRRQLDVHFKDWQQANAIEVRTMARKQTINRSVERAGLAADEAAKDGDEHGVVAAIQPLVKLGAVYPEQAQAMIKKNLDRVDHYAAVHFISNNPIAAEEALAEEDKDGKPTNFKRLTPEARLTLQFEAHRMAVQVKSETAADFFNRKQAFIAGEGPDVAPDEVRMAAQQGRITPAQAKQFLKPPKPDFDPGKFATLYNDIAAYDPVKDIDKSHYASLVARAAYDPEIKGPAATDAMEMLKKKADPKSILNSPNAQAGAKIITENFNRGIYGKISVMAPAPDGTWKLKTDPKGLAAAQEMRAKVQTALDQWLEKPENLKATPAQVQEFLHHFNRTERINSLWAPPVNPNTGRSANDGAWREADQGGD